MTRIILYGLGLVFGIVPLLRSQTKEVEGCGQYLVCAEQKAAYQHARLISNERTAIADTVVCFISGHVTDFSKQDVPFAKIVFTEKQSKNVYWYSTDMSGNFKATLPAGTYSMASFYPFYESLRVDLSFGSGDLRKVELSIGENNCLRTKLTSDRKVCDSLRALELKKN